MRNGITLAPLTHGLLHYTASTNEKQFRKDARFTFREMKKELFTYFRVLHNPLGRLSSRPVTPPLISENIFY